MGRFKGNAYVYRLSPEYADEPRKRQMEMSAAVNSFLRGTSMYKEPIIRFPIATRRIAGRTHPGEVERQLRKTLKRKATRNQADMLCKYMLFKKGKFMPGKMV